MQHQTVGSLVFSIVIFHEVTAFRFYMFIVYVRCKMDNRLKASTQSTRFVRFEDFILFKG